MTFISLRKLLIAVPVLVAVGLLAACGPYYEPDNNRSAPQSTQCPLASSPDQPRSCIPRPAADAPPPRLCQAPVT